MLSEIKEETIMKRLISGGLVLSFCLIQSAFAGVNLDIDVGVPAPL
jgi:hypothetical protein